MVGIFEISIYVEFVFYTLYECNLFRFALFPFYVLLGSSEGRKFKSDFREGEFVYLINSDLAFGLSVRRNRVCSFWI